MKIKPSKLAIGLLFILTLYNLFHFIGNNKECHNPTLNDFVNKNTKKELDNSAEYNLYFFVTPFDCQICCEYMLQIEFINKIKKIFKFKKNSLSISYIVSGDYTQKEKLEYISDIIKGINYYLDENNSAKEFLIKAFGTSRTPFLLILDSNGKVKYWQYFKPNEKDNNYKDVYLRLLKLLEVIL